jgi:hypothetical protein
MATQGWEHRWSNWVPSTDSPGIRSLERLPAGEPRTSGPDIPQDQLNEIRGLKELVSKWQQTADKYRADADKFRINQSNGNGGGKGKDKGGSKKDNKRKHDSGNGHNGNSHYVSRRSGNGRD